jgi:DNA polymerase V
MFALVDCNNFYASCERVFKPNLNGKAVVILSNNDGCVIARSNEAKAFGIPMGAPAFKYKTIFKQHQINVFSSNYALYGDMSHRVMSMLKTYTPEIEIYSIDEAFLKLEGFKYVDLNAYGNQIKNEVTQGTGIPVSVGIAPTKSLAKLANRIVKKYPKKTKGVYIIDSEEKRLKALKWLAIDDVWGIGRQHAKRLKYYGIKTAYQFTQQKDDWIKKQFSVVELKLKKDLSGIPVLKLEEVKTKKSIATTRTFDTMYKDYETVKERIITFTASCAEKLRQQQSSCNAILIFLKTNSHRQELPQYRSSILVKTHFPTNSTIELTKFALTGLNKIFKDGYSYKKAGVVVMDLVPESQQQLNLFNNSNPKHKKLMQTIDQLNQSIGHHKIRLAAQGTGRTWKMKQEKLSPCYTTRLSDVITLK